MQLPDIYAQVYSYTHSTVSKPLLGFLSKHPQVDVICIIANHIFRALKMVALMNFLPYSALTNSGICLGISLLYWLTVEKRSCKSRYEMLALGGALAFEFSKPALRDLVNRAAFHPLACVAAASARLFPFTLYMATVIWISHSTVQGFQKEPKSESCCDV